MTDQATYDLLRTLPDMRLDDVNLVLATVVQIDRCETEQELIRVGACIAVDSRRYNWNSADLSCVREVYKEALRAIRIRPLDERLLDEDWREQQGEMVPSKPIGTLQDLRPERLLHNQRGRKSVKVHAGGVGKALCEGWVDSLPDGPETAEDATEAGQTYSNG